MMEFVIKDYSDAGEDLEPEVRIVDVVELLEILDRARKDKGVKIAVCEVGACLLDWS